MFWAFIILVYSIGGFFFMHDYYVQCVRLEKIPFNGSGWKFIISSLLLGVFTSYVCISTCIAVFWEILNDICKK